MAGEILAKKTRIYGIAMQRYVYFTFLCGFLFIRISKRVNAHRVKSRGGGLKCAHLRATPLARVSTRGRATRERTTRAPVRYPLIVFAAKQGSGRGRKRRFRQSVKLREESRIRRRG
jgi:hypothetical protein